MTTTATDKAPTIGDVARMAGVSRSTASSALNGKNGKYSVSEDKRQLILRAAREIGYAPNPHAQRLATGRCEKTIALVAPQIYHGAGTSRAQAIESLLHQHGYFVPAHIFGVYSGEEEAAFLETICAQSPRALLYQPTSVSLARDAQRVLRNYMNRGGEIVCYPIASPLQCDHVLYDYHDAAYRAARHLIELGHRHIGFYHGTHPGALERYYPGFRRALVEFGIDERSEWLLSGYLQEEGGAVLASQFLALQHKPTALVVENDATASTAVNHLLRAGVKVPGDVSIIGFDDTALAANCIVPLSAVRQGVDKLSQAVVNLLLARLQGEYQGPPRRVVIQGEVVARESTAAIEATP